jgi:hypothetical protein
VQIFIEGVQDDQSDRRIQNGIQQFLVLEIKNADHDGEKKKEQEILQ